MQPGNDDSGHFGDITRGPMKTRTSLGQQNCSVEPNSTGRAFAAF